VLPGIYLRRKFPVTYGTELRWAVNKVCAEYFNGLLTEGNREREREREK
jgi:hypothetical protein